MHKQRNRYPLIVLVFFAFVPLSQAYAQDASPAPPDPFEAAREVYEDTCASCHGASGEGSEKGPQIQNPVAGYASHVVRGGRDEMAEYPDSMPKFAVDDISDDDLKAVLAFLASAPKPEDGKGLFLRYCGNCHGPEGAGGRTGRDAAHEAHEGDPKILKWVRKGHGGNKYSDRREYMPAWTADALSDAEVAKVAEYMRSVSKAKPKKEK